MSRRWAEIDLSAIRDNVAAVAAGLPPGTRLIAVVKADAYGHGALPVGRAALEAGAWGLAVSTLAEAAQLVGLLARDRILVLGGLVPEDAAAAADLGVAVMGHRLDLARALAGAAAGRGVRLPVHLKVDTGMSRLGCRPEEALQLARLITESGSLRLAGTFTHFACSDTDEAFTRAQAGRFQAVLSELTGAGIDPGLRHAGNSSAALRYPDLGLDAVRVGIALYGCESDRVRPALALRALITHVKTVPPGAAVGYGATWRAERETVVATAALGYADGVLRARSNRGHVLVRGRRAPLIGRVSMDATTLDVTGIPGVSVGDVATFIGADGGERITAEQVGAWSETISYEVLTGIGGRVERHYSE